MPPKDAFQLTSAAALAYEEQKVPAMFGPLARATLSIHHVASDDKVLDVACGTGIVARSIRERFGNLPRVVGIDLNEGMIATGAEICARDRIDVDFCVCDASKMPFVDGGFTVIICQQGLQYIPNEVAALAELRRVAADGCRVVFTVWGAPSPLFIALADSLRIHVGEEVANLSLAPFSWRGIDTIADRMRAVGFAGIQARRLVVERMVDNPEGSIPKEIMGNPIGPAVTAKGEAVFATVVAETIAATTRFRRGDQLLVPQQTHLITATAA